VQNPGPVSLFQDCPDRPGTDSVTDEAGAPSQGGTPDTARLPEKVVRVCVQNRASRLGMTRHPARGVHATARFLAASGNQAREGDHGGAGFHAPGGSVMLPGACGASPLIAESDPERRSNEIQ
jgi:hypothetical protein